jgi:hypothetical protein
MTAVSTPLPPPVAAAPKPVAAPAPGRGVEAQVGALATEADARRALAGAVPAGQSSRLETVDVSGRRYVRALVGGFADRSAAEAYCAARRQRAAPCLVR